MYLDSGAAHLWQFMVTKSRLSPFANTKAQKGRKNLGKRFDFKNSSISNTSKPNESKRWSTLVDAAVLCQKKVLLPENLGNSLLWNHQLNQTLYGFIVFEVAWTSVRGINYLNELQTDTCMALEAKLMKRWEFDSIEHASSSIHSWFSGTLYERVLLRKHLYSITGEVFFDAQEDLSWTRPSSDGESICSDVGGLLEKSPCSIGRNFGVRFANVENITSALHRLPPATMPCKRRNMTKYVSSGYEGSLIYPMFLTLGELLYTPIRLVAALASCITFLYSSIFDFLGKLWLSISIIFRIASSSEAAVSTSEVSMWRTLWNDLFSQIFRAIRSIINGLAAFFIACNRHRLSTYNHIQEFLQQISHLAFRSQPQGSSHCKQKHGAPTPMETRGNVCSKHPQHANEKAHTRHYWRIKGVRGSW